MCTSKDVAKLAGVSAATVSRVFRGEKIVTEETRNRVLEAARQLNYTPSVAASVLKKQNSHTVAFLDPDPRNSFYIRMISRVSEALRDRYGYSSIMTPDTQYDRDVLASVQLFLSYRVACIVFSPIQCVYDPNLQKLFRPDSHTKFLQLHARVYDEVSSISYPDVTGMEIGVSHLLRQGHRRILFASDDTARMRGCRLAYEKAGIARPEIPINLFHGQVELDALIHYIRQYRPTAIMAVAEMSGLKAYTAITRLGLRVPQDVSFLVYDDTNWAQALGISVIAHPVNAIVEEAVDQIAGMAGGRYTQPRHREICPRLLLRESIRPV